jgi:hypothetical protein
MTLFTGMDVYVVCIEVGLSDPKFREWKGFAADIELGDIRQSKVANWKPTTFNWHKPNVTFGHAGLTAKIGLKNEMKLGINLSAHAQR